MDYNYLYDIFFILTPVLCIFYFIWWPTNEQLIDKLLYCSYMLQHYCVILSELVVSTLLSDTSVSLQLLVI